MVKTGAEENLVVFKSMNVRHGQALHHLDGVLAVDMRLQHVGNVED